MKSLTTVLLLFAGFSLVCGGTAHAEDAIDWKARFLKDAPRSWQDYTDLKILQGSYVSTTTSGGKVVYRNRSEFKQSKTCVLSSNQDLLNKGQPINLMAMNSRYGFVLKRPSVEKPWAITEQNLNLKDGFKTARTTPDVAVQNWLSQPFNLNGTAFARLPALVKDADFSVLGATPVVRGGDTLIQIDFKTTPKRLEDGAWMPVLGGRIVCDPERYWVVRESEVHLQRSPNENGVTESVIGTYEYKDGKKKLPIPKRIVWKYPGAAVEATVDFDLIERKDVPESEFKLSEFGLLEPREMQSR